MPISSSLINAEQAAALIALGGIEQKSINGKTRNVLVLRGEFNGEYDTGEYQEVCAERLNALYRQAKGLVSGNVRQAGLRLHEMNDGCTVDGHVQWARTHWLDLDKLQEIAAGKEESVSAQPQR